MIITISRQYGSGGKNIAKMISKKLNIGFYDKELIEIVAKKTGMNEKYLASKEEKFTNDNLFFSAFHKQHFSSPFSSEIKYSTLDKIFEIQRDIIKNIANKESCVIVGRCASFILKGYENCFNVFIYASYHNRIKRIIEEYGIQMKNADIQLKNTDKYRSNYYKYYTGEDWGDMTNYNLALDSGYFNNDNICKIILYSIKKKTE